LQSTKHYIGAPKVATVAELTLIAAARTGVTLSRAKWIARRLLEADLLPKSVGKSVPQASNSDLVILLFGLCAGARGANVVEAVKALATTRTIGSVIPGIEAYTALHAVSDIIEAIADIKNPNRHEAVRSQVEFCATWPQVDISTSSGSMRFTEHDAPPNMWRASTIRETRTLPGIAIVHIIDDISKLKH
jgi:hypothetical protein